jgi:hypothetical protein
VRGIAAQAKEKIEVVHRACQQICPIYPDYATRPIQDGFSWSSSLAAAPLSGSTWSSSAPCVG